MMPYPATSVATAGRATPVPDIPSGSDVPPTGTDYTATWLAALALAVIAGAWLLRRYRAPLARAARAVRPRLPRRTSGATPEAAPPAPAPEAAPAPDRPESEPHTPGTGAPSRPPMRRLALVLVLLMAAVVGLVATVALALNFEHGRELATLNAERGWRSLLWPLAVDGLLLAASLVGLVRQLLGLPVGLRSRAAFVVGIAASGGTNVLLALHSSLSGWELAERIGVMTWPTLALLLSHEMGLQMVAHYARIIDVFGVQAPAPELVAAEQRAEQYRQERDAAHHAFTVERDQYVESAELNAQLRTTVAQLERTNEGLRSKLAEQSEQRAEQERNTVRDWEQVRQQAHEWARAYVREHGDLPTGPQIAQQFGASERWALKQRNAIMDELLDLRNRQQEPSTNGHPVLAAQ
ncbi:Protein of unknown function [Actinopolyspora alba]|uniref:DUF2637 domain-containing protein n=1 Tax=Actinopolyspora alba TaxID=673379 RepID=A0A1I2CNA2_9ACTN|nr:DUF2637 domain-containing protein [Actinopolyspora alba]SFE69714.1 Protein of unknown function [Actinopolyspora alba]